METRFLLGTAAPCKLDTAQKYAQSTRVTCEEHDLELSPFRLVHGHQLVARRAREDDYLRRSPGVGRFHVGEKAAFNCQPS